MSDIVVTIEPFSALSSQSSAAVSALEEQWRSLYATAKPNQFLSWDWIHTWLNCVESELLLCKAYKKDQLLGLGLLVQKTHRRAGIFRTKQLYLHKTGIGNQDQIWIEYNDFLLDKQHENATRMAMVERIFATIDADEFVIGASTSDAFTPFVLQGLQQRVIWQSHSYQVDLAYLRNKQLEYLSTLSKNTRYQINRSLRSYSKLGEIKLSRASSSEQALAWFAEAGPLHIERWQSTQVGSGFTNPLFVAFHQQLIQRSFDSGMVDMLKVTAGEHVICYLYNFLQGKDVKFYLSANNFNEHDKTLKPGLVAHFLAIQAYSERGFQVYDFMAGESQYKRSLSSSSSPIYLSKFKIPKLSSKIEDKLRQVKNNLAYAKQAKIASPNITMLITGGTQAQQAGSPQYNKAVLLLLQVKNGEVLLLKKQEHVPAPGVQNPNTNIIFKHGHIENNQLCVVSETQVLQYDYPSLKHTNTISHPSFNDLHHVIPHNNKLYIANTGQDALSVYCPESGEVEHKSALRQDACSRIQKDIDYAHIASTKPHLVHPNFCFVLGEQLWLTRCDTMDAICVDEPNKRLHIGSNLVHDGVVYKEHIYFTNVDGQIRVFNKVQGNLVNVTNLNDFVPNIQGWCRGILPISSNLVVVGISKLRHSKKQKLRGSGKGARLLLVDIFSQQVAWDIDLSQYGVDAIFSILTGGAK